MISEPYELTISIPVRHFTPEQIENISTFVSRNDALLLTGLPAVSTEIIQCVSPFNINLLMVEYHEIPILPACH